MHFKEQQPLFQCGRETTNKEGLLDQAMRGNLELVRQRDWNALGKLYADCFNMVRDLGDTTSFAPGMRPKVASANDAPPTVPNSLTDIDARWVEAEAVISIIGEHVWRDYFLSFQNEPNPNHKAKEVLRRKDSKGRADRRTLERLTNVARALLLLRLEAEFYRERIKSNYQLYTNDPTVDQMKSAIKNFKRHIHEYHQRLRDWNRQLRQATGLSLFHPRATDAQRLKALSKEFGPEQAQEGEMGWISLADGVSDELRYLYFDALLREKRRDWRSWPKAAWLWLLKWIIGFGVRPQRFVVTFLLSVAAFAGAYALNDFLPHWPTRLDDLGPFSWSGLWHGLGSYTLQAIANLTTIGATPRPHGIFGTLLIIIEPLVAYFFLAVLAALLYEQITNSDR